MSQDDDAKVLVPKDRVFTRTQGCWNCKHMESGTKLWTERRQIDLNKALGIVHDSPEGENDQRVYNIRKMVDSLDHAIASGAYVRCTNKLARGPRGEDLGDFVASNYLCSQWSGAQGASVARAGAKADDLPEEIVDRIDGSGPQTLDQVLGDKIVN